MEDNNIWNKISIDPLYKEYVKIAKENNLIEPGSQAYTGKALAKSGRYTLLSHVFIDSLLIALADTPKTCWQLVLYLVRNITGIGRNRQGKPKIYIKYKATDIIKKANIRGTGSFYIALNILEDKQIVFFKNNDRSKLYLNLFPLTWNIENIDSIKKIVEIELERMENNGE